jgi:DNA-binding NarL/FixJ family response regulator
VSIKTGRQHRRDGLASDAARRSRAFARPSIGSTTSGPERDLSLTGRDVRIISSLLAGHTDDEIATEVGLEPDVVASARAALFVKLGVSDCLELALRIVADPRLCALLHIDSLGTPGPSRLSH